MMNVSNVYYEKFMEVARALGAGDDPFVESALSLVARHMALTDYAHFADRAAEFEDARDSIVVARKERVRYFDGDTVGDDRSPTEGM